VKTGFRSGVGITPANFFPAFVVGIMCLTVPFELACGAVRCGVVWCETKLVVVNTVEIPLDMSPPLLISCACQ
jgi:hypothetical protein